MSVALPLLCSSDHNMIHLLLTYQALLKRGKILSLVKVSTESATAELQYRDVRTALIGQFLCDIDEMVDVVSSHICHCEDIIIPTKHVKVFPNNKLWLSNSMKDTLQREERNT